MTHSLTDQITDLIRRRRSIFPSMYNQDPISDEIIQVLLENANWAPTHRLTEPWRFVVFKGEGLQKLSDFMGESYKAKVSPEAFSEKKYAKKRKKPLQSACVIAILMQRDPEERVPEWEEVASVAAAVQNMWLTATAYGIGSYWSSPSHPTQIGKLIELNEGEICMGFFYMGYYDPVELSSPRKPIEGKVRWVV